MLTEERFAKILSILESMGSVTVQQLMTELNASESTIRRDLNALDANGQLTKVHGGAILKTVAYSTKDDNVISRKEKNRDAKNKIAKYAAEQIASGDFVYLDAGTTTELMIEYITSRQAVFVTNAISHAKRLAEPSKYKAFRAMVITRSVLICAYNNVGNSKIAVSIFFIILFYKCL